MRNKVCYSSEWKIDSFESPKAYVKQLLDSVDCGVHPGYSYPELAQRIDGIRCVIGTYKTEKNEKSKQSIASVIINLLDDPLYAPDAIPVAAELGLPDAKGWFIELSKKDISNIEQIKTNEYTNAYMCLTMYLSKSKDFLDTLKALTKKDGLSVENKLCLFYSINKIDVEYSLNHLEDFIVPAINQRDNERDKITCIVFSLSEIFKTYGDGFSVTLANRFKTSLNTELKILFFKALERNGKKRFEKYLPEIKKILEV